MLLLYACNAWAEATGYLFGEGNCGVRFRDLELSIPRKE